MNPNTRLLLTGASLLALGAGLGWFAHPLIEQPATTSEIRENPTDEDYEFINPLLLVSTPADTTTYAPLKREFESYISKAEAEERAKDISVYFRSLNESKWVGVNETETYMPSSMLKVLLMTAYLRDAEHNPMLIETLLPYSPNTDEGQAYPPATPLPAGQYSAQDLISRMIIDSDNNAAYALFNNLNKEQLSDAYEALHLPQTTIGTDALDDFMSPQEYSRIFRILYNATYLSRALSEQALKLLSYTAFKDGLIAGVPEGTRVAHKFGEHTETINGATERQLHDCGIIYYANTPYFLCVMTRGSNFESLANVIADLSRITYQSVESSAAKN